MKVSQMRLVDVQNQHQKLRIILSMYVRINNQSICDCFHTWFRGKKAGCKIVANFKDYLLELRDIGSIDDKRLTTRKHEYKLIYKIN